MINDMIAAATRDPQANGGGLSQVERLLQELEENGIVRLPDLIGPEQLGNMRQGFAGRLRRLRWNDVDGYEKTERYRHMVHDVLTLDQGFVDVAVHPLVKELARRYIGPAFELVEAKGWKSLPTRREFHGWHGDAWYDQDRVKDIPRELKLAMYLTDVRNGHFAYIRGTHGKQAPRSVKAWEVADVPPDRITPMLGPAGSAFLFDTSGIHRQTAPILEERWAVFLNYHDPSVPLQTEDVEYYRYHPLLLNAAFLGGLDEEDRRVLGFGNKTNYIPGFERQQRHAGFQAFMKAGFDLKLLAGDCWQRGWGRVKKILRLGR
jgi:hypothetical protein